MARLFLGCPMWGLKTWPGVFFPPAAKTRDFLALYSQRLNTVEGNTTFYAAPEAALVQRWAADAAPGFRFCLKLPREISHERRLLHAETASATFAARVRLLDDKIGPCFLQLPPTFDAAQLPALAAWLQAWPHDLPIAVEPRHSDFWGKSEGDLSALLRMHGAQRGFFDTVGLFAAEPNFNALASDARNRKPRFARRLPKPGAPFIFIRYVGPAEIAANAPWLGELADCAAAQLASGGDAYIFIHHSDDTHAPAVARLFHALLAERHPLPPLAEFIAPPAQASLFDVL